MLLDKTLIFGISYFKRVHQTNFEFWNSLRFQNHKTAGEIFCHLHEAPVIFKHAAVVRCAKYRDQLSVGEKFVAVVHDEMPAANEIHFVFFAKLFDDLLVECEGDSSFIFFPFFGLLFGVAPKYVTEKSCIRHIRRPLNIQNLFWQPQFWRKAPMHTKYFIFNYS